MRRLITASAAGARRVFAAKWFVPGGLEVPTGGGFSPEEGFRASFPCSSMAMLQGRRRSVAEMPEDLIAFHLLFWGVFYKCTCIIS
jgi:hypothetical protein